MEKHENQGYTALGALEKAIAGSGHKIEPGSLRKAHPELKDGSLSWDDLGKVAKVQKMRAVLLHPTHEELREVPPSSIALMKNGEYVMVGYHNDETVMFLDIAREQAVALPTKQFCEVWTGEIMTVTPKLTWEEIRRKYNLEWFYRVIIKYKQVLIEILLASAFLQVMGIMMPLFTQVVPATVVSAMSSFSTSSQAFSACRMASSFFPCFR